jgi:hypothetical protein
LETLKTLSQLEIKTIFCNLKGAVENGREALLKKISKMEQLRDRVINLRDKGLPPKKIRKKILGKEGIWNLITGGHYSKQNTIDSIFYGMRPDQIT